jgi:hypothetical protein
VAFNGLPPFSYATKAQSVRRLPVAITAVNDLAPESSGAADALKLGTLAPGASATVRFTVHVTNNGSFTLSPQVLSSPKGGTSTNVSEGRGTLTALPSALLWLSLHPVDPGLVPAGSEFLIAGTVTNRSLTDTLELQPLEATIDGGAGGGDLVDQAATPQPDGVELPVAGTIAPGQTIDVIGDVGTSLVPGTRATVSYHPSGTVEAADASTANLTADEIGMTAGSSPIEVHLDQSVAPPPPSTLQSIGDNFVDSTFYYAAKFSYLAFAGVGSMIASTPHAVGQIPAVLVAGGHSVGEVGELISSVLLLGTIGQAMSVEQRQRFADEVVADYKASHVKVAVDAAANTYAAVDRAAFNAFVPFENALQTGDYNTVAALAGEGFGAGLSASGDLLVSDIIFEKMLIGLGQVPAALSDAATAVKSAAKSPFADIITLEAALRDAKVVQSLAKGLPGIEAGMNLLANGAEALTNIYGLTRSQISALQQFCETNQLIIAVRSRSPRAAQLIKEGLAVGKNEIIKLKNVNEIDTTYLGYSSADLNTVVYAEPVPTSYVDAQLAANNADALTRSVVMARYKLRVEEWTLAKFRDVIENAENSGKIAWNFDGSGNAATTLIEQTRGFALKAQPSPVSTKQWPGTKGRVYEQVLVTNRAYVNGKPAIGSRLVPITQDVDAMAILTPSGEILSAVQRADVYEYLANLIGIEHGETPSWILDGEIIFQAKAKILADAIPGGEPLAVFGPDGSVTAGFYSAALSTFNNATNTGRIFFEGGYNSAYYYWNAVLKTSVGNFAGAL